MNGEANGGDPRENSTRNSLTPPPGQPTIEETKVPQEPTKVATQQEEPTMDIGKREFRLFEIASLGIQVILVFVGIGALCVYGRQLNVMRGTLEEMKRSGGQSTEQVWRAIDNLNWAARSIDLSQKQAQTGIEQAVAKLDIQAKAARSTANASKESNSISRESLESVQRAFLTFNNFIPREVQHGSERTVDELTPVLENSGTTPAVNTINTSWDERLGSEPDEQEFKGGRNFQAMPVSVGPKAQHKLQNFEVSREKLYGRGIVPDPTSYYAWGWVLYNDVFPKTEAHLTEFCYKLVGIAEQQGAGGGKLFRWATCQHHNCTDRYCDDYKTIVKEQNR